MQFSIQEKDLIRRITNHIRQKLELQVILTATAAELRSFLEVDRVKICKFNPDGSGQVIAESVDNNHLPSVLGLIFPGDEIPPKIRELYVKVRVRSIVNVDTKEIGQSALYNSETEETISKEIRYRSVDPCHLEYLTAMGVKSSLVLPILHDEQLWGLLACHHSQPRSIPESEVETMQMVVDQLSIAIAQSTFLNQAPERATREATIKNIVTLLHSLSSIEFQPALAQAVIAFGGSAGRLCIRNEALALQDGYVKSFADCLEASSNHLKVYVYGKQPVMPELAKYPLIEQYSIWQEHYKSHNYDVWAISDIYQIHELRFLQVALQPTKIRSILMIPLLYRQELLGYLSIFRDDVEKETLWAGESDPDRRQLYPRQSFNAWRESKKTQPREWTVEEIELADEIGKQFASAVHEHELHQQLHTLNTNLESQVQDGKTKLQQSTKLQQALLDVVANIQACVDLDTIFQTAIKQVCQLLQAERVSVRRFFTDGSDEFSSDFEVASPEWSNLSLLGINTLWNDTYLQKTQGEPDRNNEAFAVDDIYKIGFIPSDIEILDQYHIKAFAIAPIVVGEKLWGLLAAYQHSQPRHWHSSEIKFLSQMAAQLGVAIQQAELIARSCQQANALQNATQQKQALLRVFTKMRQSIHFPTQNTEFEDF
jgi:GAF domain-containing protein